ncbi:MAG: D-amino acid dehydrogenase [Ahrensia sp.]|nr:D-amino acid dehydrogenase [Ahrensia sp.]
MTKSNKTRIAILGAGITGITTAWALRRRGFDVTLIDKNGYAAMETSFANGGQLSASNAEVWNHPSTIVKGIKWMFDRNAPLLVNPKPSWHKYSWMAEFIAAIPQYTDNTIKTTRLAIAAREHLLEFARETGAEFDLEKRGILHIYRNKKAYDHATKVTQMLAEGGLERRSVSALEMQAIEPALNGPLYAGYYTESDMTGDIHKFCTGVAAACQREDVEMLFDTTASDFKTMPNGVDILLTHDGAAQRRHFDAVVVCAGIHSRGIAKALGDRVNVYPVKGYSITVNMPDERSQKAAPWVSLLDDETKLVTSRLGKDRFRVAGTAEYNGYNRDIRADRIDPLIKWVRQLFPGVSTEHAVPWAGLRPMLPNMMPKVGAGKRPGVFYNTGHGHLGWTLSGATAEIIAEQVDAALTSGHRHGHDFSKAA